MNSLLPSHFNGDIQSGLNRQEEVLQFELGDFKNLVYLILDWKLKSAAIVDPQIHLDPITEILNQNQFTLVGIFLTHSHHDHVAGVPLLIEKQPNIPVYVHEKEAHRLPKKILKSAQISNVVDGDILSVGSLKVRVLHTPGHSAGECTFELKGKQTYLFTGDTLFIRDCGRTDLPTGSNLDMFHSLQRIKAFPRETFILPGHHYKEEWASTLEQELNESPPLKCKSVEELAALP